jgi:hypothetical protein
MPPSLITKPDKIERVKLWTPFAGKVRLQVGYPDHPDKGELVDTGWEKNTVLPYLAYQLWSALGPFNSQWGDRYIDGVNVYPSWNDTFCSYHGSSSIMLTGYSANSGTTSTSPVAPNTSTRIMPDLGAYLMGGIAIGNYTTTAPSGNVSAITQANFTTYSLLRRFVGWSGTPYTPIGNNDNVYFGPAVNTSTITGATAPNPSMTISRTFAAQSGTVNAIMFLPMAPTAVATATIIPGASGSNAIPPNYSQTVVGGLGSAIAPASFTNALSGAGDPFSNITAGSLLVACTFFLASSAVVVPGGANLTMTYTLSATL